MISAAPGQKSNSINNLIAFAGVSFLILFNLLALWSMRELILSGTNDFRPYYGAALMIRRGDGARIYQDEAQHEIQREMLPFVEPSQLPFNHPAYEALLFIPLTYLPYTVASVVWAVVNIGLLAIIGAILYRWHKQYSVYLVLLSLAPVMFTVMLGQDSILLLLVFALALRALSKGQLAKTGILLGLGLFRFHLVLPFMFILVIRRQWRLVGAFLATAIALLFISILLSNPSDYLSLMISQSLRSDDPRFVNVHIISNMPTINGLLVLLLKSVLPIRVIGIIAITCSFFFLLWIGLKRSLSFSAVPAALVSSHYMYAYDLSLMALPLCGYILKIPVKSKSMIACMILVTALPVYLVLGSFYAVSLMGLPLIALSLEDHRGANNELNTGDHLPARELPTVHT